MNVEIQRVMHERPTMPSTRSVVVVEAVVIVLIKGVHIKRDIVLIVEAEALVSSVAVFRSIVHTAPAARGQTRPLRCVRRFWRVAVAGARMVESGTARNSVKARSSTVFAARYHIHYSA